MAELNRLAVKYGRYMKVSFIISLILFTLAGLFMIEDVLAQGGGGGPPKVDIFAEKVGDAILVTWENPSDTEDDIVFRYTVSRDVNRAESFTEVFDSLRNIEQRIINEENGQEMFFYLDENVEGGNDYTYMISAGRTQGNPNPTLSDDTRPIFMSSKFIHTEPVSEGHLIISGSPQPPITPIVSWFDWFNPFKTINAEVFTGSIFQTSVNPQVIESYRLALTPIPAPSDDETCNQTLEIQYQKDQLNGQDFQVTATIIEKRISRDDPIGDPSSTNPSIITITEIPSHQKTWTDFTDTLKVKQKWLVVEPDFQTIFDYKNLEVQFDIIADFEANPADHRSLTFWKVYFIVPSGNNVC